MGSNVKGFSTPSKKIEIYSEPLRRQVLILFRLIGAGSESLNRDFSEKYPSFLQQEPESFTILMLNIETSRVSRRGVQTLCRDS